MKIICIGRNYRDHAQELNNAVPTSPMFFLKPETALLRNNRPFFLPDFTQELHYEVELVYRICRLGKNISPKFAHRYYDSVGIGIDLTARDLQEKCKSNGWPWEMAKAFDNSAPLSSKFIDKEQLNLDNISFKLLKNDQVVQTGNSGEMIFSIDQIITYVSQFITLKIGDLIFTGTPAGVGSVTIGDTLKAYVGNELLLTTKIL
ncbi:MAG TPA: fumarylacetoacetate hydrolase family protein [Salinivirgaceae bacterium]|nr:fumarylacetoacetate hydrolase family protein [Salinivirgaceae bacterium]